MARKKKSQESEAERWDRFTIDAGLGKLACSYDPEGLDEAFVSRFEKYLIKNLSGKAPRLDRAAVEAFAAGALTEFIRGLPDALRIALNLHFETCLEMEKLFRCDSPMFRRIADGKYKPITGLRAPDGTTITFPKIHAGKSVKSILAPVEAYLKEKLVPGKGGPNNEKLKSKMSPSERKRLGQLYETIKDVMPEARADYRRFMKKNLTDWLAPLEKIYSQQIDLLPSLLRQVLREVPNQPPADLAIQAAACIAIPGYQLFSVSSDRLRRLRIKTDVEQPA